MSPNEVYPQKTFTPKRQPKDAHVGSVKTFAVPPTPNAPTVPADLGAQLSAYDASEPTRAESVTTAAEDDENAAGAEGFLELIERDLPKPVAHDH